MRSCDGAAQHVGLCPRHDPGLDIVVEGEHRDRRAADGEAWRCHHGRHQPLEPLPAFRQLGRNAWRAGMDLDTHMMGNEADDPFGIGGRDSGAGILEAAGQAGRSRAGRPD